MEYLIIFYEKKNKANKKKIKKNSDIYSLYIVWTLNYFQKGFQFYFDHTPCMNCSAFNKLTY